MAEHEEAARKKPRQVTGPDMERMGQGIAMVQDSGRCPSPPKTNKKEASPTGSYGSRRALGVLHESQDRASGGGITTPGRRARGPLLGCRYDFWDLNPDPHVSPTRAHCERVTAQAPPLEPATKKDPKRIF
jgi:hypothetical protein